MDKPNQMGPIGTAALGLGSGIIDNVSNMIFGGINQKRQLKGQKKALEQQNAAQLDMWNKTNYGAQKEHMEEAGLNPALLYGMSGGGGVTAGNASAMPESGGGMGMNIGAAVQVSLMRAQEDKLRAEAEALRAGIPVSGATVPKLQQDTATGKSQEELNRQEIANKKSQKAFQDIQNDIAEYGQWYQMGKIEAEWKKAEAEARREMTAANVDGATQETRIQQEKANLATTYLTQKAIQAGTDLSRQQIQSEIGRMITEFRNAETNSQNAFINAQGQITNAGRLELERIINNVPKSMQLTVESVTAILQALGLGKMLQGKTGTVIEGFKQKY